MAVGTKNLLKGFPNGITWGQQYNIGEKPTVTLYIYINDHVGTPKQKQTRYLTVFLDKSSKLNSDNSIIEKFS